MKEKAVYCCVFALLLCSSANADIFIDVDVGFSNFPNQGIVAPVVGAATTIMFSSVQESGPSCAGPDASLCSGPQVEISSPVFQSGVAETFTFGALTYTTSGPWIVQIGPGGSPIITTEGYYDSAGFTPTQGIMNFSSQPPPVGGNYTFSASGETVTTPEPPLGLLTIGGVGIVILQLKRRSVKKAT